MLKINSKASVNIDKHVANSIYNRNARVGIFRDKTQRKDVESASKGLANLVAGQKKRKIKSKTSKTSNADVIARLEKKKKVLSLPFLRPDKQAQAILNLFATMMIKDKAEEQQIINGLSSIVRQSLIKNRFGKNRVSTAKKKGFNKFGIDSGQMFKAISAKLRMKPQKKFISKKRSE